MKKRAHLRFALLFTLFFLAGIRPSLSKIIRFGESLCEDPRFTCQEIQKGESWDSLWPDSKERDVVKQVNRMNIRLRPGIILAIPKNLSSATRMDFSPLPKKIDGSGVKQVRVDLGLLAWGAYDAEGNLKNWGTTSSGRDFCPDTKHGCETPTGDFNFFRKEGAKCKSSKFPIGKGGAPMPYCMFFRSFYALHGSYELPGYRASHGCVRIFPEDAKWLNEQFVDLPNYKISFNGTPVHIQGSQEFLLGARSGNRSASASASAMSSSRSSNKPSR